MKRTGLLCAALATVTACIDTPTDPTTSIPIIDELTATTSPRNVLSARVGARLRHADSVRVRYGRVGVALDSLTPAVPVVDGQVEASIFGLMPLTTYVLRLIAYGPGGSTWGKDLELTTDALPDDLPAYRTTGVSPAPGFVVFSTMNYGVALDNTGRIVWYVRFTEPSLNFQAQPNGRYIARPATPDPNDVEPLVEFDVTGNVTRVLTCARGLRPRFHDVIALPDGAFWLMCDETRQMDLSAVGGVGDASVTGTVVQRIDAAGDLVFEWSPFEHFDVTDADEETLAGAMVNWTHGNAIEIDRDGNLLVSFRVLSEITKIDARTGAVIWRMGGRRNQFGFADTAPPFLNQHGVRVAPTGELVLLDNFGEFIGSRAERYAVNELLRTALMVKAYEPSRVTRAALGGTTQSLPDGHTLVSFGDGGTLQEYGPDGTVVWEIEGNAGYIFRAQRIQSLYHPEIGLVR